MKKITYLLALFLSTSIVLTSCSKDDEPQETLTVTETIDGVTVDKTFTVDASKVFTDSEGFEFYLTWTPSDVDVDFYADTQAQEDDYETGLEIYASASFSGTSESVRIFNTSQDTFGKTLISIFDSHEGDISYTLQVKRISDKSVIKTVRGSIQSTTDRVSFAGNNYHGFENLGEFVKDGNKFYFEY